MTYWASSHVRDGAQESCRCVKTKLISLNKGVAKKSFFVVVEYLKNILGTSRPISGTCIAENFESNEPLVWFYEVLKVCVCEGGGGGGVILYQS